MFGVAFLPAVWAGAVAVGAFIARRWLVATVVSGVGYAIYKGAELKADEESKVDWPDYFPRDFSNNLNLYDDRGWREGEPFWWKRTNSESLQRFFHNEVFNLDAMIYRSSADSRWAYVVLEVSEGYIFGEFLLDGVSPYRLRKVVRVLEPDDLGELREAMPIWASDALGLDVGENSVGGKIESYVKTAVLVAAVLYLVGKARNVKTMALGVAILFFVLRKRRIA